ncbi:phytoene desaturase family protein [Pseudosporangium ferrugineum]|uniref:Pyridine nucleotide-disulfide oxidoreductase domain-containing protein 2 n=1 Tax=Pseudosporangium ferrugineum TaxID=439699 RepID=A0A2T0RGA0_9ACTN|nr:NAD(P)/FAD-dependent oxidoreductase [Pseudosporangium ferrugineum]PRY20169.1 phytoene dehydrogenase-like protein [Pseudosporangium ferrugineum]
MTENRAFRRRPRPPRYDAVVIGAGHNGLVAANLLADEGWSVLVLEAQELPGGAVRSTDLLGPGYTTDLFSAFYPLGAASPVLGSLNLPGYGLQWAHAPLVMAHLLPDGRSAIMSRDLDETAASVDAFGAGDGAAWRDLVRRWDRIGDAVLAALFHPFPPVRSGLDLLRRLGPADAARFARFATLPVRRMGEEQFRGEGARLLLAGTALHSDMAADEPGSAVFGWLMTMVGQRYGFPVPRGGSGMLTEALVRRLRAKGGELRCGEPVEKVLVRGGRAHGVRTHGGDIVLARRAVLADVDVPTLYRDLVGERHLPGRFVEDLRRFMWDPSTLKLDWALSGPIPWKSAEVGRAGTVHLGADLDGLTDYTGALTTGRRPGNPFVVLGQMTTADPTRSPHGTEVVWAYTHLPRSLGRDEGVVQRQVRAVEDLLEHHAPGFRDLVVRKVVQSPSGLHDSDGNLVDGAINGGTTKLFQELIFRPVTGLGRPETPVRNLYLAGAGAHPGGGVHGGPGGNAARAALLHAGVRGSLRSAAVRLAVRSVYSGRDRGVLPPPVTPPPGD